MGFGLPTDLEKPLRADHLAEPFRSETGLFVGDVHGQRLLRLAAEPRDLGDVGVARVRRREVGKEWDAGVKARMALLERLRKSLTTCIGCGCLSLDVCPLSNPGDRAGLAGAGPRFWLGDKRATERPSKDGSLDRNRRSPERR